MMSENTRYVSNHPQGLSRLDSQPWSDVSTFDMLPDANEVDLGCASSDLLDDRLTRSLELSSMPGQDPFNDIDWQYYDSLSASNTPSHTPVAAVRTWGHSPRTPSQLTSEASRCEMNHGTTSTSRPIRSTHGHGAQGRTKNISANLSRPANTNPSTEVENTEKIKTKLLAAWNNMKFDKEDLKKRGHMTDFDRFKRDFCSRLWFTYRRDFPPLANTQFTTDVGWGCMLRTGQMILAQAFVIHFLGREWHSQSSHHRMQESIYHHQIIRFFGDLPGMECPFSIHRLVEIGVESGKQAGDWYGPASVAYVLRDAMELAPVCNPLLGQICLYVAQDCTIYKQDVIDLCTQRPSCSRQASHSSTEDVMSADAGDPVLVVDDYWRAVVLLIPVRLGGESLNTVYTPCVQAMLEHPSCIGIIGGRPTHSVFFIGWQDDKLIYLDPHLSQDMVDVRQRDFDLQSFHCVAPRKMAFNKMDPSCTVGFYCKTRADFNRLITDSHQMASPPRDVGTYPIYVFTEGRSIDLLTPGMDKQNVPERYLRVKHVDETGQLKKKVKESDDFVFL